MDTSIECDHQHFSGFLKMSIEEVLIAPRDEAHLLARSRGPALTVVRWQSPARRGTGARTNEPSWLLLSGMALGAPFLAVVNAQSG